MQRNACIRFARENKLKVHKIVEIEESAYAKGGKKLYDALETAKAKEVDKAIFMTIDRAARRIVRLHTLLDRHKICFTDMPDEDYDENPSAWLNLMSRSLFSEYESKVISQRTKNCMKER